MLNKITSLFTRKKINPGNQCQRLLAHLKTGQSITQAEAAHAPHYIGRLAGRIHNLRELGHTIHTATEYTETGARVGRYTLIKLATS